MPHLQVRHGAYFYCGATVFTLGSLMSHIVNPATVYKYIYIILLYLYYYIRVRPLVRQRRARSVGQRRRQTGGSRRDVISRPHEEEIYARGRPVNQGCPPVGPLPPTCSGFFRVCTGKAFRDSNLRPSATRFPRSAASWTRRLFVMYNSAGSLRRLAAFLFRPPRCPHDRTS